MKLFVGVTDTIESFKCRVIFIDVTLIFSKYKNLLPVVKEVAVVIFAVEFIVDGLTFFVADETSLSSEMPTQSYE